VPISAIRDFIRQESTAGLILLACAVAAIVLANSPLAVVYDGILSLPVSVRVGALAIDKPLLLWINDGLMAIFFFLVGLEIKREVVEGELSSLSKIALPGTAALGGMAVPAAIYTAFNAGDAEAIGGWAIPAATDIAFALGILALLGPRVPAGLKVFLLALAIIDDLGAIVIIAVFYTADLSLDALMLAVVGIAGLVALNLSGVTRRAPYLLLGLAIWVCVLKSGVHATLAGVVTALAIPLRGRGDEPSPLAELEHVLHPWVALAILPAFAFANAGVSFAGLTMSAAAGSVPLGIGLGLFLGKQAGVFVFVALAVRTGLARLPDGITWAQVYGVAVLAGIGFTMSLFIGSLAFADPARAVDVRLGVLAGSVLSALLGYAVLHRACRPDGRVAARSR
jgi:NhaA family Na+:H+ antiporter